MIGKMAPDKRLRSTAFAGRQWPDKLEEQDPHGDTEKDMLHYLVLSGFYQNKRTN
jgi:hypothetical protein